MKEARPQSPTGMAWLGGCTECCIITTPSRPARKIFRGAARNPGEIEHASRERVGLLEEANMAKVGPFLDLGVGGQVFAEELQVAARKHTLFAARRACVRSSRSRTPALRTARKNSTAVPYARS